MIFEDIRAEVIQVTTGEGSHDDFNISAHFSGDLLQISLDIAGGTVEDFFEFTSADLAGLVGIGGYLEGRAGRTRSDGLAAAAAAGTRSADLNEFNGFIVLGSLFGVFQVVFTTVLTTMFTVFTPTNRWRTHQFLLLVATESSCKRSANCNQRGNQIEIHVLRIS